MDPLHAIVTSLPTIIMLSFAGVFLAIAQRGHVFARWWGLGYLAIAGANVFEIRHAAEAVKAATSSYLFVHAFYLLAFFLFNQGCLTRFALRRYAGVYAAWSIGSLAIVAWYVVVKGDLRDTLVILNGSLAATIVVTTWRMAKAIRTPVERGVAIAWGVCALDITTRTICFAALLSPRMTIDEFRASPVVLALQIASSITGLLVGLVVLTMVMLDMIAKQRDDAESDVLTGLLNRRGLERAFTEMRGDSPFIGIVMCDLDHFKRINDEFGHATGDDVIRAMADTLRDRSKRTAALARLGGEEFVVLIPGEDLASTAGFAESVRQALAERIWPSFDRVVSASFGATVMDEGEALSDAIERADAALYVAKEAGRNRVALHAPTGN